MINHTYIYLNQHTDVYTVYIYILQAYMVAHMYIYIYAYIYI